MPMAFSASLTSSSLNGLMMASTFFHHGTFLLFSFRPVYSISKARSPCTALSRPILSFSSSTAGLRSALGGVNQNQGSDGRKHRRGKDGHHLNQQLLGVAEEKPGAGGVHGRIGSSPWRAPRGSAHGVHPEGVQRIVISDLLFESGHREEPQGARGQTDEDRRSQPTNPAAGVMATRPPQRPRRCRARSVSC